MPAVPSAVHCAAFSRQAGSLSGSPSPALAGPAIIGSITSAAAARPRNPPLAGVRPLEPPQLLPAQRHPVSRGGRQVRRRRRRLRRLCQLSLEQGLRAASASLCASVPQCLGTLPRTKPSPLLWNLIPRMNALIVSPSASLHCTAPSVATLRLPCISRLPPLLSAPARVPLIPCHVSPATFPLAFSARRVSELQSAD